MGQGLCFFRHFSNQFVEGISAPGLNECAKCAQKVQAKVLDGGSSALSPLTSRLQSHTCVESRFVNLVFPGQASKLGTCFKKRSSHDGESNVVSEKSGVYSPCTDLWTQSIFGVVEAKSFLEH